MYLRGLACASCNLRGLACSSCKSGGQMAGLGDWIDSLLNNILYEYTGEQGDFGTTGGSSAKGANPGAPSSGSGAGVQTGPIVATNVQTQVSPQISPSFVQQQQPQNSAVTTTAVSAPSGPSISTGNVGLPGNMPGFDSGYMPNGMPIPLLPTRENPMKNVAFIAAGLFAVGAVAYRYRHKIKAKLSKGAQA